MTFLGEEVERLFVAFLVAFLSLVGLHRLACLLLSIPVAYLVLPRRCLDCILSCISTSGFNLRLSQFTLCVVPYALVLHLFHSLSYLTSLA